LSQPARWYAAGDINGFFALAIDNLAMLAGMSGILIGIFHVPADLVVGRMLPGSAVGVLVGDLGYSWMAIRLARREGRDDVCAMPLGLDAPSVFGITFGVIGPAWLATRDPDRTLAICTGVLAILGILKTVAAFAGDFVRRNLPRAAMLSAMSAVAIALIAFFSMSKIILEPIGGFVSLGVVLCTLVAGRQLPFRVPAMVAAVALGTLAWACARHFGYAAAPAWRADTGMHWMLPLPSLHWVDGLAGALPYLPLAIPFALATLVGGIDNAESAAAAGDRYDTRDILLVEGIATFVAALFGGVMQNTPYIGHPAYKRMGCRSGYTVATAFFIGLGASAGVVGFLITSLPESVLVPVLVFVGLELSTQAFRETDRAHLPAIVIAFIPAMADLALIHWSSLMGALQVSPDKLPPAQQESYRALLVLSNGFIVTSMIWSTVVIDIIDRRRTRVFALCLVAAALTLCGVIHSPYPDGRLFMPGGATPALTVALAAGYVLLGATLWSADRTASP
jgi:adenine/guanine/hypoxanthine permease